MEDASPLAIEFVRGNEDYLDVDERPLRVTPLAGGGTLVVAYVSHPGGEWIKKGAAFKTPDGFELVYHTHCNGELAFERYGCELQFMLKAIPYDLDSNFKLRHVSHFSDPEL